MAGSEALLLYRRRGGLDVVREPSETFEQAFTGRGTTGHHVPDLVLELGELEGFGHFLGFHGCGWRTRVSEWCFLRAILAHVC
jgi:hypothetical protein